MNPSIIEKLENLGDRQEEINALLSEPEIFQNQDQYRKLTIELSDKSPSLKTLSLVIRTFKGFTSLCIIS